MNHQNQLEQMANGAMFATGAPRPATLEEEEVRIQPHDGCGGLANDTGEKVC
jgi:hypothetical protein